MMLIGLSGYAGSGKDLFVSLAREITWCTQLAFADALRREVEGAFGVSMETLLDRQLKGRPSPALRPEFCTDLAFAEILRARGQEEYSPREIMQLWGTEYRRAQKPNYWLERAAEAVEVREFIGYPVCFITDTRFPNEAGWIESRGGQVWRIDRPGVEPVNGHSSERALDDWKFALRIRNDGSIEQLRKVAFDLVSTLLPVTP